MKPVAARPRFPEEYGVPTDTERILSWSYVDGRLAEARHYWLSTVTPSGAPHTRPIDGLWLDGRLYFGGDPGANWRRNLERNPSACLNLEDGQRAVILHGTVSVIRSDRALAERMAKASQAKYELSQNPSADSFEGQETLMFEPSVAYAWNVFFVDATRWRFGAEG